MISKKYKKLKWIQTILKLEIKIAVVEKRKIKKQIY